MVAPPNSVIDEDITCQSNTISRINRRYLEARDSQSEAHELTSMFIERFPEWADQYMQQAQSDTNMPPFTAEDKQEIEELAAHVAKLQSEILEKKLPPAEAKPLQAQAHKELLEIREKLPKNPNSSQQQQQQQDQQQDQQQQDQQPQEPEQQEPKEEEQKPEPKESQEKPPEDVQELLRRALEREKEHEEDKKKQIRNLPMLPSEKDW